MPTDIAGFIILGAIEQKWLTLGGSNGSLGLPTSNETAALDNVGRKQDFQHGVIYWHPDTGAHEIYTPILDGWYGASGFLGYPTAGEIELEDGGRMQPFKNGVIYWHPDTGAHEVYGPILQLWKDLGWESSVLGYPAGGEMVLEDGGRMQPFQHGLICWHSETGAHEIYGPILQLWKNMGWDISVLSYPKSSEQDRPNGGRMQDFKNGTIAWTHERGPFVETVRMRRGITTPSGTALGGWAELEFRHDGTFAFRGHMHDSGFDPYTFRVRAAISSNAGVAFAIQQTGSVEGTLSDPFNPLRDFNWEEWGHSQLLQLEWSNINFNTFHVAKTYEDTGILGGLESIAIDLVEFIIMTPVLQVPAAIIHFIGKELGKITNLNLGGVGGIPGLILAAGATLLFGAGWAIPVFVGTMLATNALVEHQVMTDEQYNFANLVFKGSLPPRETIILTNLSGLNGRQFVAPNAGGGAIVNLGKEVYKDPIRAIAGSYCPGEVFIHEMVHVWQLARNSFIPGYICKGIFDSDYNPKPEQAWSDMNIEQQGTVVNEWYRDATSNATWSTLQELDVLLNSPSAIRHKYFTYIHNQIRAAQN